MGIGGGARRRGGERELGEVARGRDEVEREERQRELARDREERGRGAGRRLPRGWGAAALGESRWWWPGGEPGRPAWVVVARDREELVRVREEEDVATEGERKERKRKGEKEREKRGGDLGPGARCKIQDPVLKVEGRICESGKGGEGGCKGGGGGNRKSQGETLGFGVMWAWAGLGYSLAISKLFLFCKSIWAINFQKNGDDCLG